MDIKCNLIIDSCCDLPYEVVDRDGVYLLKFPYIDDEGEHLDDLYRSRSAHDFYESMRNGSEPQTAQIPMPALREAFEWAHEQGKPAVYLSFSSGLSGTFEAISLLCNQLAAEFPERKIFSVDTLAASGGEGLLVWHAVQKAREGLSIEELRDWVEQHRLNLAHWFTVDDLMFLWRGGRVSKTSAWAGTLLNIKPVLHVDDEGHLIPMEKVRGRKKSLNALVDHMEKSAIPPVADQMVFITHGDCLEDAEYVADKVRERFGVRDVVINYVDPVIGAHSGPGTMALFYMAESRN